MFVYLLIYLFTHSVRHCQSQTEDTRRQSFEQVSLPWDRSFLHAIRLYIVVINWFAVQAGWEWRWWLSVSVTKAERERYLTNRFNSPLTIAKQSTWRTKPDRGKERSIRKENIFVCFVNRTRRHRPTHFGENIDFLTATPRLWKQQEIEMKSVECYQRTNVSCPLLFQLSPSLTML